MAGFKRIAIIGVGLIGGSLGLGIKKRAIAREVVGVFRHRSTLKNALKAKAVDKGFMSVKDGVKLADLIIIATPVLKIPEIADEVMRFAPRGAVITDVGSTKKWIVDNIEKRANAGRGVYFVGSHPMAGSEHAGVAFARPDLMEGSPCIVTKTRNTDPSALKRVVSFWRALGARVDVMSPQEHDRNVALVSHLPHIVAFGLAGAVPAASLEYAAEGFKDTTRIASSDPELWADIFITNGRMIRRAGIAFDRYYKKISEAIADGDYNRLVKLLSEAKSKRDRFAHYGAKK